MQLCYRNVLNKAKELGLHTIGLCTLSVPQRNYPSDIGAHIALSKSPLKLLKDILQIIFLIFLETIRKFLETNNCEVVILCLEPYEVSIYEVLAPLYFPRNLLEETSALCQLPKHNESTAAAAVVDQQIRITRNPQHNIMIHGRIFLFQHNIMCELFKAFSFFQFETFEVLSLQQT